MPWTQKRLMELPEDWEDRRIAVLRRDRWICQVQGPGCQTRASEVDHIARGDNHDLGNLRAICTRCHIKKSASEGHQRRRELQALKKRPPERHPGAR